MRLHRLAKTTACTHVGVDPKVGNEAGSKACAAVQGMGREARTEQGSALSKSTADLDERQPMPFMEMRASSRRLEFL